MPNTIPSLESYIKTLQQGISSIQLKDPEEIVGLLGPQGRVAEMTIQRAILQLRDVEIKALTQLQTIKQRHSYVGEVQPQDTDMTNTMTSRRTESIDNPLFSIDEVDIEPKSSISFTPKRTHRDDLQIIP